MAKKAAKTKSNEKSSEKGRGKHPNSLANLKPFEPGQSGNPAGWPKGKRHTDTLIDLSLQKFAEAILDKVNEKRKSKRQKALTLDESGIDPELDMWMAQLEKARNGDTKAFELIQAYRHGKPTQNVNLGGQPGNPILHEHEFVEVEEEIDEWESRFFVKPEDAEPLSDEEIETKKKDANSTTTKTRKGKARKK